MGFADSPSFDRAPTLILPPAATVSSPSALAWTAANRAVFDRFYVSRPTTVRYLNWRVDVASGNVQVGVVRLGGAGMADFTRVAHSGVIACPAAADIRTDLGATVLTPGEYALFQWADNVTMQTRWFSGTALATLRTCGILSSAASGVPATGTLTWSNIFVCASLEGDV